MTVVMFNLHNFSVDSDVHNMWNNTNEGIWFINLDLLQKIPIV